MRARSSIRTTEPTRYEVVLLHNGEQVERLGFTPRRTYRGLMAFTTREVVSRLIALNYSGVRMFRGEHNGRHAYTVGNSAIAFTGRTERECAGEAVAS